MWTSLSSHHHCSNSSCFLFLFHSHAGTESFILAYTNMLMSPVSETSQGFPLLERHWPNSSARHLWLSSIWPILLIQWFSTTRGALKEKQVGLMSQKFYLLVLGNDPRLVFLKVSMDNSYSLPGLNHWYDFPTYYFTLHEQNLLFQSVMLFLLVGLFLYL